MSDSAATRLTTEPATGPAAPPKDDGVIYDPADDLLPPPKPATDGTPRTSVTTLVMVNR